MPVRPIPSVLFVLDDVIAREPRPSRYTAIDDNECILLKDIGRRLNASDQFVEVHRTCHHYNVSLGSSAFVIRSAIS